MAAVISLEIELSENKLIEAFRRLSPPQRVHLLDKLNTLEKPMLRTVPASRLHKLIGIVSLGGDALQDSEEMYEENSRY